MNLTMNKGHKLNQNLKVMIVEDEIVSALALSNELKQRDYTVCKLIVSGQKAIEKVAEEKPDVIFMDIRLQGPVNGIEAAQQINSRFGVPIVFMTGDTTETLVDQLKEMDHIGFLSKPVQINEVIKLLQNYFHSR
jgi:CheY-like chemotaxis protein